MNVNPEAVQKRLVSGHDFYRLLKNSNARGFEGAHLRVRRHKSFIVVSASRLSGRRAVRLWVFQQPVL